MTEIELRTSVRQLEDARAEAEGTAITLRELQGISDAALVNLEIGDLELDPARKHVTRAGQVVDLTAREFALLEYLMRQRGNVVTKQQIMANVWNFDFEGDSNIVEVYVGRLRRKIDKPFGREDIETLRGTGYRMRLER